MQTLVPAQLIIGAKEQLLAHAELLMQKTFCPTFDPSLGCFCSQCRRIKNRQHPSIIWISPEKDYTVDDLDIIFQRTRFALDPNETFFFILDKAHALTMATANKMLKVLEEPPAGYHFLLLTPNPDAIMPTIHSRCFVIDLGSVMSATGAAHPLLAFFLQADKRHDPFAFEQELKKQQLNDGQSVELLHLMVSIFTKKLHEHALNNQISASQNNAQYLTRVLEFLVDKMRKPPQSGSSEMFWKHLFLTFPWV